MLAGQEKVAEIGFILLQDPLGLVFPALIICRAVVMLAIEADVEVPTAMGTSLLATDAVPKFARLSATMAEHHRTVGPSKGRATAQGGKWEDLDGLAGAVVDPSHVHTEDTLR